MKNWQPDNWLELLDKITELRKKQPRIKGAEHLVTDLVHDGFEMGADAILEALKKEGIKGEVKACCNPVAMPDGDVSFDDFDTNFISEDKELEVCLNGAEDIVYGKQVCHIITPKKGWLVFIPDETNKEVKE